MGNSHDTRIEDQKSPAAVPKRPPKRPTDSTDKESGATAPLVSQEDATVRRQAVSDSQRRLLNVMLAVLCMLISIPLLMLISIAVKSTSSGSVFYTQSRVGLDRRRQLRSIAGRCRRREDLGGRIFTIIEFRTMSVLSCAAQSWARPQDPLITRVGAFLRRHRLDELPQFLNVIIGDMNIVGPRPEQPEIFLRLKGEVAGYTRRQRVLPGITGWAQINHRYDQRLDDVRVKTSLDLEYLRRRCMAEDTRIMVCTVPVMLRTDLVV